jgi:subtilisin family serine protease
VVIIARNFRWVLAAGLAVALSGIAVSSAAATPGLTPRTGQWWFTSWKILPKVWPLTQGAGVTVAVLDSGVQASVPDLRGVVLPGGDVTGHLTNGERDFNTIGDGHGTMMSVLIAGQGYGTGVAGVAPKAKILPVVVNAGASDVTAAPGAMAAGIRYAASHGAQVIDVSQEYPSASAARCDPAEQAAVAYALARDVVVIAAAGDKNLSGAGPSEPASCAGVLAVAAVQPNRSLWPGDTSQPYITVVNPGADLITSGRDGRLVTGVSGTRAASALAAGAVALIRSRYPALRWYQVIQRLTGTALRAGGHVPNDSYGYGILRLSEAPNATAFPVPASAPDPVYAKFQAWLATPQGRAVSRQLGAPRPAAAAAPRAGAGDGSTTVLIAILVPLAAAAAIAVMLAASGRLPWPDSRRLFMPDSRRLFLPDSRKQRRRGFWPDSRGSRHSGPRRRRTLDPASAPEEYLPFPDLGPGQRMADEYMPLGESAPYRVPPYSPSPAPGPAARTSLLSPYPDDRLSLDMDEPGGLGGCPPGSAVMAASALSRASHPS